MSSRDGNDAKGDEPPTMRPEEQFAPSQKQVETNSQRELEADRAGNDQNSDDESSEWETDRETEQTSNSKGEWYNAKQLAGVKKINGKRHYKVLWEDPKASPSWISEDNVSDLLKEMYHIKHTQQGAVRKIMKKRRQLKQKH